MLPTNLQSKETFAVYDQVRTLNASRFHELIENGAPIEVVVSDETVDLLLQAIINNLIAGLDIERKNSILSNLQ